MRTSSNRVYAIAAIVVVGAAILLVAYLWLSQPQLTEESAPTSSTPPEASGALDTSTDELDAIARSKNQQSGTKTWTPADALPPLPPNDLPLNQQLPALIERAEAGDPSASCRLIYATNRCKESARNTVMSRLAKKALAQGAKKLDPMLIEMVASTEEQISGGFCDGVRPDELPSLDELYRRALPFMSPRQRTLLALMRSDGKVRRLRGDRYFTESALYIFPQFIADHAHELLLSGFQAHDPLALEGLVLLHAPGGAVTQQGASPRLPNPRLFLQYALTMENLYGPDSLTDGARLLMTATAVTMSPDELKSVHETALEEADRWRLSEQVHQYEPGVATSSEVNVELASCSEG